jgi:hypothetical protein
MRKTIADCLAYNFGKVSTAPLLCNYLRNPKTCGKNCTEHKVCVSQSSAKATQNAFDFDKYLSMMLQEGDQFLK